MPVTARLDLAIFDAADIARVGSFYAELTGWDVVRQDSDRFGIQTPDGQEIEFQRAPDHVAPRWPGQEHPQRFHLDLQTDDPLEQAERAVSLGATRLADGPTWITLADPGRPSVRPLPGRGRRPGDAAVRGDDRRPRRISPGSLLRRSHGLEVTYDGPEGALIAGGGKSLMFQQISGYNPPRWPDPAHPQQAHLDLLVDDLDTGECAGRKLSHRP